MNQENTVLRERMTSANFTEKTKEKLNYLEDEIDDISFNEKCISTVKELSEILVFFLIKFNILECSNNWRDCT